MRVLVAFHSPWLPVAALWLAGASTYGSDAVPPLATRCIQSSRLREFGHRDSAGAFYPGCAGFSHPASTATGKCGAPHTMVGFRDLLVYRPGGPPTSFVLLLSGDEGWSATADTIARQLVRQGAMVASIDWVEVQRQTSAPTANNACSPMAI